MLQVDGVEALKSFRCMWAGPSPVTPVLPLLPVSPVTPVLPVAPVPPIHNTMPSDVWETSRYGKASIKNQSVRHCQMSCTKASTQLHRGSQIIVMHMGSAITGNACAATVAGVSSHSGAASGSGTTYIQHDASRCFGNWLMSPDF